MFIFTGSVFNRLSPEERLLFQTSYSVEGTCIQCSKKNERNTALIVSYISEVELGNCNDFINDWSKLLSVQI